MRLTKTILFGLTSLTALYLAGCGERVPTGPEGASSASAYALLPPASMLDSAKLLLHSCHSDGQTVVVHPQSVPWNEASVNWNQIGPALSPFVLATFRPHDTGWVRVDVTGLLKLWLDGVWANHGIVLDQNAPEYLRTNFDSRESRTRGPRLILYYSVADSSPVFSFAASGDAKVDASLPLDNYGSDSLLQTGWTSTEPGECRTLIAFDLSRQEAEPVSRLGDRVWLDSNQDGIQGDEEGFPGVSIQLLSCEGQELAHTVSDSSGHYHFDSLEAGSYLVHVELPAGFLFTQHDAGDSDLEDSDVDGTSGRSACIALGEGEENLSVDAGLKREPEPEPRASVGDRVWLDLDRDGLQENSEPGAPGIKVTLHNCEGALIDSSFTDAEGHYGFSNLQSGHYKLQFHKPEGLQFSPQVAGDWAANSDADPETGLTECFELSPGEEDRTRDAGLYTPEPEPDPVSSLGDRVWLDENKNGVQNEGEGGVADVGVVLLNCEGAPLADTRTDAFGIFLFDSLPAGSYRLRFLAPEGLELVPAGGTSDSELDSDPDTTGLTGCIELSGGVIDLSHDAGLCTPDIEPEGCTRSRCFWKEHSGRHGDPDWVTRHLPIWLGTEGGAKSVRIARADSAGRLLSYSIMGGYFNGITRLYAEMLTARLNQAEGATPEAIQAVLNAADAFLAGTAWQDWCNLSHSQRCQVYKWQDAIEDWNEGRTGPGACPE